MYTDNGKKTIFDDVKPKQIVNVNIPEFNDYKQPSGFHISHASLDDYLDKYNTQSFSKFDIVKDDELFDLWGFGDVSLMTQNPEYKYKYPKFTKSELIKQRLQTEEGTSNKLNTILRAEESGASIEEINEFDDEYNKGLAIISSQIDKEAKEISDNLNKLSKETDISEARKRQQQNILKEAEDKLQGQRTKVKMYKKRYNPVLIKPALNRDDYIQKVMNDGNLLNSLENEAVYLNTVRRPKSKSTILQQEALQSEIKKGKELKSISKAPKPPMANEAPSSDLPSDKLPDDLSDKQIEKNKEAFKKAIAEGKQNLKNKKAEEYNKEKSKRYENLEKEYNDESKKQVAHESLILKGYDEVISKLGNLGTKKLSNEQRTEINEMLKKIDGTNIGAITQTEAAIKRLKSKKEKIEEHKTKILDKMKKQDEERKAPRRVSRSSKIMELSKLPDNDDNSDFSIKKTNKSKGPLPPPVKNKT